MGLLEALLGKQNPLAQWAGQNSNFLGALGAGIASGPDLASGIGQGLKMAPQAKMLDMQVAEQAKAKAEEEQVKNYTRGWLQKNRPDLLPGLEMGMTPAQLFAQANEPQGGGSDFDERFKAGQAYGLTGDALNTFALTGAVPGTNKSNVTYGTTPIWGTFDDGTQGYGVQGSDGSFKRPDLGGFQPKGPYDVSADKAAGTAFGKNTGGAQFDMPAVKLSTDQTLAAIADVRANEKGLDEQFSMGGLQQMTPAWPGSEKAKFQVANNRLTNRAFLEAREVLRGGGQITDFESRKAEGAITNIEDAMARGDKALYLKALADFEQAVKDGYAKLEKQAGTIPSYGGQPTGAGGRKTSTGVNYTVEP